MEVLERVVNYIFNSLHKSKVISGFEFISEYVLSMDSLLCFKKTEILVPGQNVTDTVTSSRYTL